MVIVAETVLISQALVSMWTILAGAASPRDYAFHAARDALLGPVPLGGDATDRPLRVNGKEVLVDVFITVYGEPLATIRGTATAAQRMTGRHRTWILDDGRSDEVKELAAELGVHYVRRLSNNGAKAGNVNHALSIAKGDYFAIFDADFVPKDNFLLETVPFFVSKDVAFVQTPQTYGNFLVGHLQSTATCRPCSTGSSNRAATTSTRRSASAPTSCSAGRPSTTSGACTPTPSPRTCGPR